MSNKLIYTPDTFTSLVNQTIDFNANQGLASYVKAFAAYTHREDYAQEDAITMLQNLYHTPNINFNSRWTRDNNMFISRELQESGRYASVIYSILLNDGLIISGPAEDFAYSGRNAGIRPDHPSYSDVKEYIARSLDNWNGTSSRKYHISDDSRIGLTPCSVQHSDALAMFFIGMSWSIRQVKLQNLANLAELSDNGDNNAPKILLLQSDNYFYLAGTKLEPFHRNTSITVTWPSSLATYNTRCFNVAGFPEINLFDEVFTVGSTNTFDVDQLTYEGYVSEYITQKNGVIYENPFVSRNYLMPWTRVQALSVIGVFSNYGDFDPAKHIKLSEFGPRYSNSNFRDYYMPIMDVPQRIKIAQDNLTGLYSVQEHLIIVRDTENNEEFVITKRNDNEIEAAGLNRCDCGSQNYVHDVDEFADALEWRHEILYQYIKDNYVNPEIIFQGLLDYVWNQYDEEGPSDGYYCSDCGSGEGDADDHEYRQGYFNTIADSQIDSINTALAAVNKKVSKTQLMYNTVHYVADANQEEGISVSDLDDYKINDYDYDPDIEFVKKDEENPLYLGLEWEMDFGGKSHNKAILINSALCKNKRYSYTMSDGSLEDGIEIATMPATLAAHLSDFDYDSACTIASTLGYRGHDTSTSGIHIHMSRSFFGKDKKIQNYKGALMALVLERNWDSFVKFSRRRYDRLDQWAKKKDYLEKLPTNPTPDDYELTFRQAYDYDKYVALNTRRSETFELRIFRSTLKSNTIKATLQLVHNLATWVKHNDLAAAQQVNFEQIVNYIPHNELNEYWQVAKEREVRD